jgi:hypothetical protein
MKFGNLPETANLNETEILKNLNSIAQFIYFGTGVPTFTPPGRALYIRLDGGAATTLYVWEGAAWVGK